MRKVFVRDFGGSRCDMRGSCAQCGMDAWVDVSVDVDACRWVCALTRWHVGGLVLTPHPYRSALIAPRFERKV